MTIGHVGGVDIANKLDSDEGSILQHRRECLVTNIASRIPGVTKVSPADSPGRYNVEAKAGGDRTPREVVGIDLVSSGIWVYEKGEFARGIAVELASRLDDVCETFYVAGYFRV